MLSVVVARIAFSLAWAASIKCRAWRLVNLCLVIRLLTLYVKSSRRKFSLAKFPKSLHCDMVIHVVSNPVSLIVHVYTFMG
jgi:hypothetical protein